MMQAVTARTCQRYNCPQTSEDPQNKVNTSFRRTGWVCRYAFYPG